MNLHKPGFNNVIQTVSVDKISSKNFLFSNNTNDQPAPKQQEENKTIGQIQSDNWPKRVKKKLRAYELPLL